MSEGSGREAKTGSFWSTLPGVLTGVAALIGSIAGLLALFLGGGNGGENRDASGDRRVVPEVVGDLEEVARGRLLGQGFSDPTIRHVCSVKKGGTVIRQSPQAQADVVRGAAVSLTVASG